MFLVKICAQCKKSLSVDLFGKRKYRKDGYYPYCRKCDSLYKKAWIEKHPEIHAKSVKKSAEKRKRDGYAALYYLRNKEKIKQQSRENHANNRERDNARERARYKKNPKAYYLASREWIAKNPEKAKKYQEKYREAHREQLNKNGSQRRRGMDRSMEKLARRSREANRECAFTEADWQEVLELFDYKCAYCHSDGKLTRDHFLPLTYPVGDTVRGNIVPACLSCNSSKCDKVPCEWVVEKFGLDRFYEVIDIVNYLTLGVERGYLKYSPDQTTRELLEALK